MKLIAKLQQFILDLIFPRSCLGCGQEDTWLCPTCLQKIKLTDRSVCPVCKKNTGPSVCPACQGKSPLDGLLVASDYDNPLLQSLLHHFKYSNIREIGAQLGTLMTSYLQHVDKTIKPAILTNHSNCIITAVPLHTRRLRERGYNQAAILSQYICNQYSIAYQPDLLKRTRYTPQQALLNKKQRINNLKNAFTLSKPFKNQRKTVILVDDVATTLATLEQCAQELKKSGIVNVWGLVVARGK